MKNSLFLLCFCVVNTILSQVQTDSINIEDNIITKNIIVEPYNPLLPPNTYPKKDNPN